jgi:hypothetical protein
MKEIEEIKQRSEKGYTMSIYGNRDNIHEQMEKDIEYLCRFNDATDRLFKTILLVVLIGFLVVMYLMANIIQNDIYNSLPPFLF